jgi:hypothetical protein
MKSNCGAFFLILGHNQLNRIRKYTIYESSKHMGKPINHLFLFPFPQVLGRKIAYQGLSYFMQTSDARSNQEYGDESQIEGGRESGYGDVEKDGVDDDDKSIC